MSTVVHCSHAIRHGYPHWITRAPRPHVPWYNILRIYDTDCWVIILITMVSVSVFLVVAAKLGTHYGVGTEDWVDVALVPFRYETHCHWAELGWESTDDSDNIDKMSITKQ